MNRKFENKVAIVTGGNSGIGSATAIAFAQRGARVVIADINEDKAMLDAINADGHKVTFIKCDVSKSDDVKKMTDDVIALFGRIDYAFNNAGIEGISARLHETTEEDWDRTLSINLKGIWLCMKYEIPHMLRSGKGAIVNCASVAGLVGFAGASAYVASKHGVAGLTKAAALENAKTGIRVNAVCPGIIHTPMIERATGGNKEVEQQMVQGEPVGRMGTPGEIAEAVVWLCSDNASFVTGHAMPVDGGWVAQ